ncbi:hypothetical protein [Qipengyuania qiaonensis]|uniref:Uncharacterized protein n=1 Tax=Qipengyuania qiaonensis TaxID=2867240 RepID=A0ABS7J6L5_9SPHN|nr:hypothetical protein [Qipengyuania qiaonensis]MBX7482962.1 hypothetical protein [Qipengyuania qiaonensis]
MPQAFNNTRHADLVNLIATYLEDSGRSARWFGLRIAKDARLVPHLARGQEFPSSVLVAACEHILAFYQREALSEVAFADQVIRPARLPMPLAA